MSSENPRADARHAFDRKAARLRARACGADTARRATELVGRVRRQLEAAKPSPWRLRDALEACLELKVPRRALRVASPFTDMEVETRSEPLRVQRMLERALAEDEQIRKGRAAPAMLFEVGQKPVGKASASLLRKARAHRTQAAREAKRAAVTVSSVPRAMHVATGPDEICHRRWVRQHLVICKAFRSACVALLDDPGNEDMRREWGRRADRLESAIRLLFGEDIGAPQGRGRPTDAAPEAVRLGRAAGLCNSVIAAELGRSIDAMKKATRRDRRKVH